MEKQTKVPLAERVIKEKQMAIQIQIAIPEMVVTAQVAQQAQVVA